MELKIEHISKSYKKKGVNKKHIIKNALSDINLSLQEGIYGLMGANGAGKTTLMNIIVGNLKPDNGSVYFNGDEISKLGSEYKSHIGYMPQQQWVYETMTCLQFLTYMAALKDMDRTVGKQRIEEVLELVHLSKERHKKVGALSGGMKQRLIFAQAILNDPDIIILDEPTAGVDPSERIRIRNLVSEISFHKIVIIATHVVSDIEFISNEFLLMKEGELLFQNKLDELVAYMDGKVWECKIPLESLKTLEKTYTVVSLLREGTFVKARIVTEDFHQEFEGTQVQPTLEDLFILYGGIDLT